MQNKYSDTKIVWFSNKLQSFRKNVLVAPIYVRVKPTNRCNQSCHFCVYKNSYGMHETFKQVDELSTKKLIELYKDFKDIGVKATTLSGGGEPLLHPEIDKIMQVILDYNIDLSIITNGTFLKDKSAELLTHAKWVRVSVNYSDFKMFAKTRSKAKYQYLSIVKNIENFAKVKPKTCDLSINYIIDKYNYNQLLQAAKFYKELGVEIIRFSPVWMPDFIHYHSKLKDKVEKQLIQARYLLQNNNFKIFDSYNVSINPKIRDYSRCFIIETIPVIGADGNVYTCHNKAYDNTGLIGSIKNRTFSSLWFSKETQNFFETFNAKETCKHQCANDNKNLFLHSLMNNYGDNFV